MVRWLSPDEQEAWRALGGLLVELPGAIEAPLRRDADLSLFGYFILSALSEAPDRRLQMSALAAYTGGSLSRLSHLVKRLEQRGWVRREPCPGDSRSTDAFLTEAGMATVVEAAPGHAAAVRDLVIGALTPEQVLQLRDIGRAVSARIHARTPGRPALTGE